MKRAIQKKLKSQILIEPADPGQLVNTLRTVYCCTTAAIPIYSCYYIGSRLDKSNLFIFVCSSFIAMTWVGLFQMLVFKYLPQNPWKLLWLFISSYLWLYIQHFFQPDAWNENFNWVYFYVSLGLSYTLCVSLPYALLVIFGGLLKFSHKIEGMPERERKTRLEELYMQFIIIIPCLITSGFFAKYIIRDHLLMSMEWESMASFALWFMGIAQNVVSYYFLLKSQSILNDQNG
jgi:hypothetical protein